MFKNLYEAMGFILCKDEPNVYWIVSCSNNEEVDTICTYLPATRPIKVKGQNFAEALTAFNSGASRMLIGHKQFMSAGYNIHVADPNAVFGVIQTFEEEEPYPYHRQLEGRVSRLKADGTQPVLVIA